MNTVEVIRLQNLIIFILMVVNAKSCHVLDAGIVNLF